MEGKSEAQRIEESEAVANLKRRILRTGSPGTAKTYIDRLKIFFRWLGKGPDEFLAEIEAEGTDITKTLNRWLDDLHSRGKSPSTQSGQISAIKKLVEINIDTNINWARIELPKLRKVEEDVVPTKEVIGTVRMFSTVKEWAITLVATSSGLRLGTMAKLSMEDLDLESEADVGVIRVPAAKSKNAVKFATFITPEARKALEAYLSTRKNLSPKDPVFAAKTGRHYSREDNLANRWTVPLGKAGLDQRGRTWRIYRFHTLRKFFRTALEYAGISKSFRERLLGHLGDYLDDAYFGPEFDRLIEQYRRAIPYLTIIEVAAVTRVEAGLEAMRAIATTYGIDPSQVAIGTVSAAAEINLLRGAIEDAQRLRSLDAVQTGPPIQAIIEEEELEDKMAEGWLFKAALNNGSGKLIIERPS